MPRSARARWSTAAANRPGIDVASGFGVALRRLRHRPHQVTAPAIADDEVGYDPDDSESQDPLVDQQLTGTES